MRQYLVRDVMKPLEEIVTISPYARVRELLKLMHETGERSIIVDRMGPHDAYGIVTHTNILSAIYKQDGDMDMINVYDIATKPIIQVVSSLDIKYAARLMVQHSVRYVAVTWQGDLVGLLSMGDIADVLMQEARSEG